MQDPIPVFYEIMTETLMGNILIKMHTLQQYVLVCLPAINAYTIPCLFRTVRVVNNLVPETVPKMLFSLIASYCVSVVGLHVLDFSQMETTYLIQRHILWYNIGNTETI